MLDVIQTATGAKKSAIAEELMIAGGLEKRYAEAKAKLPPG